jgi:hypothetical protein
MQRDLFIRELTDLLNKHGLDAWTHTPDYVLANYVTDALDSLRTVNEAVSQDDA